MSKFTFYLVYCGRNDNYADQNERIPKFIDYYASLHSHDYNIELVLVDWNTPKNHCSLLDAFSWNKFSKVHSIVVNEKEHKSIDVNDIRSIVDYAGRNRGLDFVNKTSGAGFAVIVNQDIFIKKEVLDLLFLEDDNNQYFYRADRTDIIWLNEASNDLEYRVVNVFERLFESPLNYFRRSNKAIWFFEYVNTHFVKQKYYYNSIYYKLLFIIFKIIYWVRRRDFYPCVLLGVHGNASGDFLAIPKRALKDLDKKYPETTDFYMHTDSYILFELIKIHKKQCIIRTAEAVLHVDHARNHKAEAKTYQDHLASFQSILDDVREAK